MNRVTITGADDNTPITALIELSDEFPFVEWGILVSMKHAGSSRFPSEKWTRDFADKAAVALVDVSMHVCGDWVRRTLRGRMGWADFPEVRRVAQRVQINTHAEEHVSTVEAFDWMAARASGGGYLTGKQFIIQLDGVNDHLLDAALARNINAVGLFDCSHGAGLLPKDWPTPRYRHIEHGYAGGLGPENVVEQIRKIADTRSPVIGNPLAEWWIDMEGRVRDGEEHLDLGKVRQVLEACKPWVGAL